MYNVLKSFYHKSNMSEWVSEWLLFNAKWVIFQLIVRISYIQWDDDDVCFVLDQHAQLDFYSPSSVKQQSASRYVTPLGHIILILNQPVLLLLLNTACLVDKQLYQLYSLWFYPIRNQTHDLPVFFLPTK